MDVAILQVVELLWWALLQTTITIDRVDDEFSMVVTGSGWLWSRIESPAFSEMNWRDWVLGKSTWIISRIRKFYSWVWFTIKSNISMARLTVNGRNNAHNSIQVLSALHRSSMLKLHKWSSRTFSDPHHFILVACVHIWIIKYHRRWLNSLVLLPPFFIPPPTTINQKFIRTNITR